MHVDAAAGGNRVRRDRRPPSPGVPPRLRRIALVAAIVVLVPTGFSFALTLGEASNSPFGIRAVEWLRDHGAAGLVASVETFYYDLTAPAKGGPTLRALPKVGFGIGVAARAEERPAPVVPFIHPALPGEGVWRPTRPAHTHNPPLLVTTLRDQPEYPKVVAGLAWINTKRTTLTLNPGRLEPSVELPRGATKVPAAGRSRLLATFNSGFKLADDHGGFAVDGQTYAHFTDGQGTIVGYANGSVDVVAWNHGPTIPRGISFARQNLPLIVNEGRPSPQISNSSVWGVTVGNATLVWRSAIGVDRHGNLVYVAGDYQTVASLARVLIHAGAVRAMELDINSFWVTFISYGGAGGEDPAKLLEGMERPSTRYLEPDDRDFFALYSR
jgi:hypothetical protein